MATMDTIKEYGGTPANFLDIGGGAREDKVEAALRIILSDPNVKAVMFNIFGGITRGDVVAKGIINVLNLLKPDVPMVVRLAGTNAEEGRQDPRSGQPPRRHHSGRSSPESRRARKNADRRL